jgi:hypothetical protein
MITGRCLCETVAFAIDGWVSPVQLCHARRCRRASGTAFAAELVARAEDFRWLRGEAQVRVYEAPLLERPPAYRRAFCEVCGSPMPVRMEGAPLVGLHAGTLDGDPGVRPVWHAFVGEMAPWDAIHDALPRFDTRPPPELRRLPREG